MHEILEWARDYWMRVIVVIVAMATISIGALGLEHNQREVRKAQTESCERENKTNDGIRNILTYLDQRRQQGTTPPLTPEQAKTEAHVRELIPPHEDC